MPLSEGSAGPTILPCQRELFEVDQELSYFACAAMAPLLRASVSAGICGLQERARPWTLSKASWFEPADERRLLFSHLINCAPEDIALVPSTSYGAAVCARACDLSSSCTILTIGDEFPSTAQTWRSVADQTGARILVVEPHEEGDWTAAVIRSLSPEVKLVAIPTVRWTDGARVDVEMIGSAARAIGATLFVDATQSLGVVPFDIATVRPDYLAASGYKWLLGPYGHSYLYVAPECQKNRPLEENWIAREGAEDFERLADPKVNYPSGARRFDAGQQAGFELGAAACAALRQIDDWGVEQNL